MKNVLIVAAHPDDEVLGCGGLIAKYNPKGVNFRIIIIGEGSSCRFENPKSDSALNAIDLRKKFAINSFRILGITNFEFYDLPCGRFDQIPIIEINKIIEKNISSFSPDSIFTHSNHDVNNDHKVIFNATMMSSRPGIFKSISRVFTYEVPSSSEWSFDTPFCPNYFEEITENMIETKFNALSCYESEIKPYPFPRSLQSIKALAMYRGTQSGCFFAESYHLIWQIKN